MLSQRTKRSWLNPGGMVHVNLWFNYVIAAILRVIKLSSRWFSPNFIESVWQSRKCDLNFDARNREISLSELIITSKVITNWHGKKQFMEPRATEFDKTCEWRFGSWWSNHGCTHIAMSHKTAALCLGILNSTAEKAGTTTPAVFAAAVIAVAQCCLLPLPLLLLHTTATITTTSITSDASSEVSPTTISVFGIVIVVLPFKYAGL